MDGTLEAKADPNLLPRMPARTYNLRFLQEGNENISEDERKASVAGEQVVNLLNQLIGDALSLDASDIHIEPHETELSVRYRIDGRLLKRAEVLPMRFANAISSRLKALASMNITERRKPQDGRLGTAFNNREVSLRISTIPTRFGEKIVMRVLDKSQSLVSLDRIIGLQEVKELVRSLVFQPHGIVLITGPTGSGKTTTMYSAILERKEEGINIVTVEDPIEYTIPGITQVQYNDAVDLGYAEAIKAFLRQDTDIMLIGETRDARTASYAMQAALSGHLVVTSLHTNSALSTIYRLREMGIEPFLIGNALAGVIAQRLLRTICSDCREPHTYHPSLLSRIFEPGSEIPTLYHGPGCARCNRTGYRGRAAVFEVIRMSEDLRSGIAAGSPMKELRTLALDAGMVTFKDYCRKLLVRGLTTPSEIMRVLYSEDDNGPKKEAKACSSCGFSNALGNRYCEECGTQL
jgi:type IV pilus assembly protein PilB